MPFSYFESGQLTSLIISAIFLITSVLIFKKFNRLSLLLLFVGTIILGYFFAQLDPFLNLWDEQYHALVAKNLVNDFTQPRLYADPILEINYRDWTNNHIWLHKQPLFLWQLAASIKLFGTNELAVRIPSIMMHAIIPLFIFRIGLLLKNKETGYYGALLFAAAFFPLELVAGAASTDHNDIAFLFYITASFWSWFEYIQTKKPYWLLLIGLFSGCAVLVKWLLGLLIYFIWLVTKTIVDKGERLILKSYLPLFYSAIVSLVVFLPWQVYLLLKYPKEFKYEFKLKASHFYEAIEGHSGSTWFHFTEGLKKIYGSGDLIPVLLILGIIFFVLRIPKKIHKVAIVSIIVFTYTFFTIAATKMVSFTIIATPFIYLSLGHLISSLASWISSKLEYKNIAYVLIFLVPIISGYTALNVKKVANSHTALRPLGNRNRAGKKIEKQFISGLKNKLSKDDVIFNASITVNGHISIMFYTTYTAYEFIPTKQQILYIQEQNKKVVVVDIGVLPEYIRLDKNIKLLKLE